MKVMDESGMLHMAIDPECVSTRKTSNLECARKVGAIIASLIFTILILGYLIEYSGTVFRVVRITYQSLLWVFSFGNSFWGACVISMIALMLWSYGKFSGVFWAVIAGMLFSDLALLSIHTTFDAFSGLSIHQKLFLCAIFIQCFAFSIALVVDAAESDRLECIKEPTAAMRAQKDVDLRNQALREEVVRKVKL